MSKTHLSSKSAAAVSPVGTTIQQAFTASPNLAIPDNATLTTNLTVAGLSGSITDLNVTINIAHTWDADLDVYLISPTGQQIELFTDVGGRGDNFFNTVLDNEAATLISKGTTPFTGSFRPEGNLAVVNGLSPNGEWMLKVTDDEALFSGTLKAWSLDFSVFQANHAPTGEVLLSDMTPEQNQLLSVTDTLADVDGLGSRSYQWLVAGTPVATGNSYTVSAADVGKAIAVLASYTDGLGKTETVSSAVSSAVTVPIAPGFTISPLTPQNTGEDGSSVNYSISLNTAPLPGRTVVLNFTSSDTSEGVVDNPTLTFTDTNYAVPQILTVRGVDDYLDDKDMPYQVTATISSIDVFYKSLSISPFSLTNRDDGKDMALDLYGDAGGSKIDVLVGGNSADKLHGLNMADDLSGGLGNDSLWGGYGDDVLWGNEGDDYLQGEQENDLMNGGPGNDFLFGTGGGLDTMIGGPGDDTYYLDFDGLKDVIDDQGLATDKDTVIMPFQLSSYTLPSGIENGTIAEGSLSSNLTGNDSDNTLTGNDGVNNLVGAVGRDVLFGGGGNDVLSGGVGSDTLTGGSGKDSFVFNAATDGATDKITDFKPIDDTIKLDGQIFTQLTGFGTLDAGQFVKGENALEPNDYIIYNPSTGTVTYDSDGSGAGQGVQIAQLGVNLPVTNADFVVI